MEFTQKKKIASLNTYELVNNRTIKEQASSKRSSYVQRIFFYIKF